MYLQQMPPESEVGMTIALAKHHTVEDFVRSVARHDAQRIDEREYTNIVMLSGEITTVFNGYASAFPAPIPEAQQEPE